MIIKNQYEYIEYHPSNTITKKQRKKIDRYLKKKYRAMWYQKLVDKFRRNK